MKYLLSLALVSAALVAQAHGPKFKTLKGVFLQEANCAETGYALKTSSKSLICVGFHTDSLTEKDLIVGQTYSLGGYLTEDGFFATEISD